MLAESGHSMSYSVTFESHTGEKHLAKAKPGQSLLEIAKQNMVRGVDGDCGGSMVCGTCHVLVGREWRDKLPGVSEMEAELLQYVPDPRPEARLSCQIPFSEPLDTLTVRVPERQR
jgi:2Fe-2S ferredoxin